MITWQWRPASDAPDVHELITRAAVADQEMGFSAIAAFCQPDAETFDLLVRAPLRGTAGGAGRAGAAETSRGEVVAGDTVLAGCIRLRVSGAEAEACLLIDPDYRSLGIATAVLEDLGRPSSAGSRWPSPGLRRVAFWAAGSHPASERLARRFGLTATAEVARLRRRLTAGAEAGRTGGEYSVVDLADLDAGRATGVASAVAVTELTGWRLATAGRRAPGDYDRERVRVALDPDGRACGLVYLRAAVPASTGAETEAETVADEATAPDRTGLITAIGVGPDADRRGVLEALITDALRTFACLGEHYAEVTVTAGDTEFAALLRSMRFRHDQTDVCYELS